MTTDATEPTEPQYSYARFVADTRAVITVSEAADLLGVSPRTAYRHAAAGWLPTIRMGRGVVVPRAALARLLQVDAGEGAVATARDAHVSDRVISEHGAEEEVA